MLGVSAGGLLRIFHHENTGTTAPATVPLRQATPNAVARIYRLGPDKSRNEGNGYANHIHDHTWMSAFQFSSHGPTLPLLFDPVPINPKYGCVQQWASPENPLVFHPG